MPGITGCHRQQRAPSWTAQPVLGVSRPEVVHLSSSCTRPVTCSCMLCAWRACTLHTAHRRCRFWAGTVLEPPQARPPPYKAPKLSECYPLFQQAFNLRGAGAVLHSHSINAVLASMLSDATEFSVTHLEMIKVQLPCTPVPAAQAVHPPQVLGRALIRLLAGDMHTMAVACAPRVAAAAGDPGTRLPR